jgi:Mg2+ and Co2+ transporter CorA
VIVDKAIYRNGVREPDVPAVDELFAACRSGEAMAWIGLYEPTREELDSVAKAFHLHELAVEDAVNAHQRPKFERYDGMHFLVLRPARITRATLVGATPPTEELAELNEWARRPPPTPQADPTLQRRWIAEDTVQAALALIAREAVELLTAPTGVSSASAPPHQTARCSTSIDPAPGGVAGVRWRSAEAAPK